MKQHDIHNDEALYQQMLAELAPGAEEYDKLIAEGKHPAAKARRTIPYYKYAAAACVLLAVAGGGALLMMDQETDAPLPQPTATIAQQQPTHQPDILLSLEPEQPSAPQSKEKTTPQRPITTAEPHQTTEPAPTAPGNEDCPPAEMQLALLNEIEYRAALVQLQDEYLHRTLIEELTNYIIEQPEEPQLVL